jgi:DNA-binding transcriptional MerR regulator
MKQWYVKDLSTITGISTQTLHHYDRIDLLKPSVRLSNGYRVYSENDLLKLQQIIALKYVGFELNRIKELLAGHVNVKEHLSMQAQFLKEKADSLLVASNTLTKALSHCPEQASISWESIIPLIDIFRVTQELEKSWAGKIFTNDELKQYAQFKAGLKTCTKENKLKKFQSDWLELSQTILSHLDEDPRSDIALQLAKQGMNIINGLYGKENANLRHKVWEEGIKTGVFGNSGMSLEAAQWLDKAFHAYYREQILCVLNRVGFDDDNDLIIQWDALLVDMFGDSQSLKQAVVDAAMLDDEVSDAAREWLKLRAFSA